MRLPLFIRADATTQIGTGHIMRCLALAQAWKAYGGEAIFVTACESDALRQRLVNEGFQVVMLERAYPDPADWKQMSQILRMHPGAWVVLDGYHFDAEYHRLIKEAGHPLLVIDDMAHLDHYYADIVLNQNIHAENMRYSCEPHTRLLLGTKYVLLREEFLKWWGWRREISEVARKVLVTLGGCDPNNVALKVIQGLQQVEMDNTEAVVVVGSCNPHFEELRFAVQGSQIPFRIEGYVANMAELMAWADVAVSAGGSTCWELAFMGLPSLILVLANNQRPVAERLDRMGVAANLGWCEDVFPPEIAQAVMQLLRAPKTRAEMSQRGQQLVDGGGVNRVLMYMRGENVRFRRVRENDCRLVWEWANDPDVRAVSFSSEPIRWEEHVQWFKAKLSDPDCLFLIAIDSEGVPIGQARFDMVRENKEAVISVSIDRKCRGKGYGSAMIRLASQKLLDLSEANVIHAYIKRDNEASIRAFVKAGYRKAGAIVIRGHQAVHLLLQKQGGDE